MAFVAASVPAFRTTACRSVCEHRRTWQGEAVQQSYARVGWQTPSAMAKDAAVAKKETKKDEGDMAPPPATFYQAITQAVDAARTALKEGETLLEVEFPPLPTARLESSSVGAYEVLDANISLAVDFARPFAKEGKRVAIQFPDFVEKDRAVEQNNDMEEPVDGIRFGMIKDGGRSSFIERIWAKPDVEPAIREDDDMFVVIGATAQELPDVEKLVAAAGSRPVILFNLKLDTSRGDLGLPAFPRKDLHRRFLTKVLPVYYLRTRTYSRSLKQPPYIVNYSGALYRVYPGPYQVLLDTSAGNYRRLSSSDTRPSLGEVRDTLTEGLDIDVPFKEFLGQSKTWWESAGPDQEASQKWRS